MPKKSITSKLTAPERQALLHADAATGRINISNYTLRANLRAKGYAESTSARGGIFLTEHGWRLHAELMKEHQPFNVQGIPWPKMQEITDLYLLTGLSIDEISRRTRVTGDGVTAVLSFRRVLVAA